MPSDILFSYTESDKLIAYGGLTHIDWVSKNAEISYLSYPESEKDFDLYFKRLQNFLEIIKILSFEMLKLKNVFTITYPNRIEQLLCLDKLMLSKRDDLILTRIEKHTNIVFHELQNPNNGE